MAATCRRKGKPGGRCSGSRRVFSCLPLLALKIPIKGNTCRGEGQAEYGINDGRFAGAISGNVVVYRGDKIEEGEQDEQYRQPGIAADRIGAWKFGLLPAQDQQSD